VASTIRLPPDAALVWGLSHGCAERTVTENALGLSRQTPPFTRLTGERCRHIMTELREAGLLADSGEQRGAM
jgi:hypothetical protein